MPWDGSRPLFRGGLSRARALLAFLEGAAGTTELQFLFSCSLVRQAKPHRHVRSIARSGHTTARAQGCGCTIELPSSLVRSTGAGKFLRSKCISSFWAVRDIHRVFVTLLKKKKTANQISRGKNRPRIFVRYVGKPKKKCTSHKW